MKTQTMTKPQRRKVQLLAHYDTCARIALELGMPAGKVNGKKISTALWNLEKACHAAATAFCNGERCQVVIFLHMIENLDFGRDSDKAWERVKSAAHDQMRRIFGVIPEGFRVNGDARGYALKITSDTQEGRDFIAKVGMHRDWGSNGIFSPEITGE